MYNYIFYFFEEILKILEKYPCEIIENRLKNIYIKVSRLNYYYYFFPYLISEIKNPKNLVELRNYVTASCYIPIFSYYQNIFLQN